MTQALAFELADYHINVNCVCPGITDNTGVWSSVSSGYVREMGMAKDEIVKKFTAKIPLRRLASIEDVVAVTTLLASKGADYMTGQAINITGGQCTKSPRKISYADTGTGWHVPEPWRRA